MALAGFSLSLSAIALAWLACQTPLTLFHHHLTRCPYLPPPSHRASLPSPSSSNHYSYSCVYLHDAPSPPQQDLPYVLTLRTCMFILTQKKLPGLLQQWSQSSWLWSSLIWHAGHRRLFGRRIPHMQTSICLSYVFTAMGLFYSYREFKCIYHQSCSQILFSLLGKIRLENDWISVYSCQSPVNPGSRYLH